MGKQLNHKRVMETLSFSLSHTHSHTFLSGSFCTCAPVPPSSSSSALPGDGCDPSLYSWLESRWMGSYIQIIQEKLAVATIEDVKKEVANPNATQAENDAHKALIIDLFDKPGLRLKMRLLLEQLQKSNNPSTSDGSSAKGPSRSSPSVALADGPILEGLEPKANENEIDLTDDEKDDKEDDSDDEAEETAEVEKRLAASAEEAPAASLTASEPVSASAPVAEPTTAPVAETKPTERPLWKEALDKSSGKRYWYHRVTKETTWDNPFVKAGSTSSSTTSTDTSSTLSNDAPSLSSSASTNASTPTSASASTSTSASVSSDPTVTLPESRTSSKADRPEWKEAKDPSSGKSYWYSRITKVTTWKNPYLNQSSSSSSTSSTTTSQVNEDIAADTTAAGAATAAVTDGATEQDKEQDKEKEKNALEEEKLKSEEEENKRRAKEEEEEKANNKKRIEAENEARAKEEADKKATEMKQKEDEEKAQAQDEAKAKNETKAEDEDETTLASNKNQQQQQQQPREADDPTAADAAPATAAVTAAASTSIIDGSVPSVSPSNVKEKPIWREAIDKSSGKPYWYHRITKETTWTKPLTFNQIQNMNENENANTNMSTNEDANKVDDAKKIDDVKKADDVNKVETDPMSGVAGIPSPSPTPSSSSSSGPGPIISEKPLWRQVVDKSTGKPYWYNRETKETTWTNPIVSEPTASEPATAATTATETPAVNETQTETATTTTNELKSVADPSESVPSSSPPQPQSPSQSPVESTSTTETEVETAAGLSSTTPTDVTSMTAAATATAATVSKPVKPLWREVVDKASGKPYWYNRQTRETTWVNPISTPSVKSETSQSDGSLVDTDDKSKHEIDAALHDTTASGTAATSPAAASTSAASAVTSDQGSESISTLGQPQQRLLNDSDPIPNLPPAESESDTDDEDEDEDAEVDNVKEEKDSEKGASGEKKTDDGPSLTKSASQAPSSASSTSAPTKSIDAHPSDPTNAPLTLKERMARLQAGGLNPTGAPLPSSSSSSTSSVGSEADVPRPIGIASGLKERLAQLAAGQQAASSSMTDKSESRVRASSFQRKQAGLAETLGNQLIMGASVPSTSYRAKSSHHPSSIHEHDEEMNDHTSTVGTSLPQEVGSSHGSASASASAATCDDLDREYNLPPTSDIIEPQKSGFLDKLETTGLFKKTEWNTKYCLLKDDGLFWLNSKKDKYPKVRTTPTTISTISHKTVLRHAHCMLNIGGALVFNTLFSSRADFVFVCLCLYLFFCLGFDLCE